MNLHKYEVKYKAFIKAEKRWWKLKQELQKLPVRPLKEPYQRGWDVTIRLRDDVLKRKDIGAIKQALEIGYRPSLWIRSVAWVKLIRQGKKSVFTHKDMHGRPCYYSFVPAEKELTEKEYGLLPEPVRKWFGLSEKIVSFHPVIRKKKVGRCILPDYWIQLRVRPHMVTHQYIKGGPIEKEIEELRDFLWEYWRKGSAVYRKYDEDHLEDAGRTERRAKIAKILKGEAEDYD